MQHHLIFREPNNANPQRPPPWPKKRTPGNLGAGNWLIRLLAHQITLLLRCDDNSSFKGLSNFSYIYFLKVFAQTGYGQECDWWSLGVIMWVYESFAFGFCRTELFSCVGACKVRVSYGLPTVLCWGLTAFRSCIDSSFLCSYSLYKNRTPWPPAEK